MAPRVTPRPLVLLAILLSGIALARAQEARPPSSAGEAESGEAKPRDPTTAPEADPGGDAALARKTVQPNKALKGYDPNRGAGRVLHVVPIDGTIDIGLAAFVERIVQSAAARDIIMLQVNTFGGRVDAAVRIRDALLQTEAITVAYVQRAISAGALISLACDTIIMSPGASIGAATPVQQGEGGEMKETSEKVVSYMRAEMGSTADANGRRRDLAEAMVDADVEVKDVKEKGKVLTLTTERALALEMAEDQAGSFRDAVVLLNLEDATRADEQTHWAEKVARFLTDPTVASLLMTLGFLGLMAELFSPGFGFPGVLGGICLALFFLGQYAANLAGAEEAIVIAIGVALLALEILVIPGFGVAGIAGIACLLIGLGMAMVELELPWDVSFELGYLQEAFATATLRMLVVVLVLVAAAILLFRYGPKTRAASWLVFKSEPLPAGTSPRSPEQGLGAEAHGGQLPKSYEHLRDAHGIARTVLRPSGIADFDGERVHVVTDGQFVEPGTSVEVTHVEGHRVVVREIESYPSGDAPGA